MKKEIIKLKAPVFSAEEIPEIADIARQKGITVPSVHTAFFKAVYAPIEKANGNGISLSRKGVMKSLKGLIGSQVNLEHMRHGFIVGFILDAWINGNDEIEVAFTFAKNIYSEEYDRALGKLLEGTLSVSFELSTNPDTKESLDDGTVRLHDFDFEGMGLLIDNPPAYKNAQVFEFAKKYRERALQCDKREFMYASKVIQICDEILEARESFTTNDSLHAHRLVMDDKGNGNTITIWTDPTYSGDANHSHDIIDFEVQEGGGHTHDLAEFQMEARRHLDPTRPKRKKRKKDCPDEKSYEEVIKKTDIILKNEGGTPNMNEEQKKLVEGLREELGEFAKDVTDETLLDEAKVEEIRKAKAEADEKAKADAEAEKEEASELEKAQTRIAELEAKINELETTLEAKNSEVEEVRENAEKIAKLKIELADNPHAEKFKDEDYLNDLKVEDAKQKFELDQLRASNEKLEKDLEAANKEKIEAGDENLNTGHGEDGDKPDVHEIINRNGRKKK